MQREWIWRAATVAALVALVVWSAWQRYTALSISPFPLGVDGYFYPVQLRSLLETGALQYPSSPLTFWWLAPFAAATDPITGTKLGAAIGTALVALPAYGIGWRLTKQRGASLVAAAVAATASTSTYLPSEFVKQGIGLTVALTAIWLLLRALSSPSRTRIALAVGGFVLSLLAHKLAAGIVIALAVPAVFEEARGRGVLRGRRLLYLLIAGVTLALTALVLGIVAPQRFLSPEDLALAANIFTTNAHWDGAALVTPNLTLSFDHEAAIAGTLAIVAAILLALRIGEGTDHKRSRGTRMVAWMFVALALVIALPWLAVDNPQGLGFRLRVTAFVPLAIVAALVAAAAASYLAGWQRDAALVAVAVIVARAPHTRGEGRVLPHPSMVSAVMAATSKIPAGTTVIVPERHILFMTAWYTRAPVRLRPDAVPYGQRMRLMPGAFISLGSPFEDVIEHARADTHVAEPPLGLHPRHRNGLVLVTEPTWDWLIAALPPDVRGFWARWSTI